MDLYAIALDYFTDFKRFEQLAAEIVAKEGYGNITVIGGVDDEGIDAQQVKYFADETKTTIFQFTIQENIGSKINDTVQKLIDNKIAFNELVIVTKTQVNNSQALKTKFREKYKNKYKLEILERATMLLNISTDQLLFTRYFPDIQQQLQVQLLSKKTIFGEESKDSLTNSLLKCSLLFTFNKQANPTRKNLIDKLIMAVLVDKKEATAEAMQEVIKDKFKRELQVSQISSALERLQKENLVKHTNKLFVPSKRAIEQIEGGQAKIAAGTKALIDDIIQIVKAGCPDTIDKGSINIIEKNIKSSLHAFFRLHVLEYSSLLDADSNVFADFGFESNNDLIVLAKKDLNKQLGDLLVYAIGATIKKPTREQAQVLADWCKAFISMQIMSLDPTLKEFQATNFSQKTFIIDTDVLLYCLVAECRVNDVYVNLIKELQKLKCKLIIPTEIIAEVIKHGDAEKNYNYFKNTFDVIDDTFIEDRLHNVFVKGYYSGIRDGKLNSSLSFRGYLANYINTENPYDYLIDLIEYKFPNTFTVQDIRSIYNKPIDQELFERLSEQIFQLTKGTFKAGWRTVDENRQIAENDALIYLSTYLLNKKSQSTVHAIMPGSHYLLTSSTRAAKCGRRAGLNTTVVIKPEILISTLEQIGYFDVTSADYVNLFENPYLIEVAKEHWSDIKKLVDAGVDLTDKNPVRLKYDLQEVIHDYLSSVQTEEVITSETDDEEADLNDYMRFVFDVKSKGYRFSPSIEKLIEKYREIEKDRKQKQDLIIELMKHTETYGKRRQNYFDRIAKKKK